MIWLPTGEIAWICSYVNRCLGAAAEVPNQSLDSGGGVHKIKSVYTGGPRNWQNTHMSKRY